MESKLAAMSIAMGCVPGPQAQRLQGSATASTATTMQQPSSDKSRTVGIVYDQVMEWHVREDHPEHPDRVKVLNECLVEAGLLERCVKLPSRMATDDELLTSHSQEHIGKVSNLYNNAPSMHTDEGELLKRIGDTFIITGDIFCNAHTNAAARSAAGCAIQAVESVITGEVDSSFAIVRPPGHHAEPLDYMGFCFFNNVAVAAHAALKHPGIKRVLVLDWDIHHGNGTQKVFWKDDRVLFVSLHRRDKDFYPEGIGYATEVGEDAGRGFNVNVPWSEKGVGDADYMAAFELILEPIIREFDPQLIIISAGFDAADGDFLGKCHVSEQGFAAMTKILMQHAQGKVAAVLEGGYVPRLLGNCAASVLSTLLGDPCPPLPASTLSKLRDKTAAALASIDEQMRPFWKCLAAQPPFASAYKAYKAANALAGLTIGRPKRGQAAAAAAAAATGHICGAVVGEGAAACGSGLPLAARAPPLSSAAAGKRGRKPGVKAVPAAAAAAGADMAALAGAAAGKQARKPGVQPAPVAAAAAEAGADMAAAAAARSAASILPFTHAEAEGLQPPQQPSPPLSSSSPGAAAAAAQPAGQLGRVLSASKTPPAPAASTASAAVVVPEPGALPAAVPVAGRKIMIKLGGKVIAGSQPPAAAPAEAPAAAPVPAVGAAAYSAIAAAATPAAPVAPAAAPMAPAAAPMAPAAAPMAPAAAPVAPAAAAMAPAVAPMAPAATPVAPAAAPVAPAVAPVAPAAPAAAPVALAAVPVAPAAPPAAVAVNTAPPATPAASAGGPHADAVTAGEQPTAWLPGTPTTPPAAPSTLTNLTTPAPVSSHTCSHDRHAKTAAAAGAAAVTPAGSVTPTRGYAVAPMLPLSPVANDYMQLPVELVKQETAALGTHAPAASFPAPVPTTGVEHIGTAPAAAAAAALWPADVEMGPALPATVADALPDSLSALVAAVAAMSLPDSPPRA